MIIVFCLYGNFLNFCIIWMVPTPGIFSNLANSVAMTSFDDRVGSLFDLLSRTASVKIGRVSGAFNCDFFIVVLVFVPLYLLVLYVSIANLLVNKASEISWLVP